MRELKVLLVLFLGAILGGCIKTPPNPNELTTAPGMEKTFVILPYGSGDVFWEDFRAGAAQAAAEGGYQVKLETLPPVWTIGTQDEIMRNITAQGPSGIILGPLHRNRMQNSLTEAVQLGIPVVVAASNEDTSKKLTYVGSDNTALGGDLAQWVAKKVPANGKIALMNTQPGMRAVDLRQHALVEKLQNHQVLHIPFQEDRDLNYTESNLQKLMADALRNTLQKEAAIAAVISPDENSTAAAWDVLQKLPAGKRPLLFGVSVDPQLIAACNAGNIAVLIKQNPRKMGSLSAQTIIEFIHGKRPGPQIVVPYDIIHAVN